MRQALFGYNDTAVAKGFLDGYSSYDGTIEAYAEEVKTAYLLGKEAGERGISDMIKTLPKMRNLQHLALPACQVDLCDKPK